MLSLVEGANKIVHGATRCALLAAVGLAPMKAVAQRSFTVEGRVLDAGSGAVVDGATVFLITTGGDTVVAVATGESGQFTLEVLEPGGYRMSIERLGYRSLDQAPLALAAAATIEVSIHQTALVVDPITVVSEALSRHLSQIGFYERQANTSGHFITRQMIDRERPREITQMLQRVPGAYSVRMFGENRRFRRIQMRSADFMGGGKCLPRLIIDGVQVRAGGPWVGSADGMATPAIDDYVSPHDIEGIEVYRSPAELPPRFGGIQGGCGAIVIWTRVGG